MRRSNTCWPQAHKLKTYNCSYLVFISLQHPHLMEAQCSPQLECYEPWVKALLELDTPSLTRRSDADCSEGALWCWELRAPLQWDGDGT